MLSFLSKNTWKMQQTKALKIKVLNYKCYKLKYTTVKDYTGRIFVEVISQHVCGFLSNIN